MKNHILLSIACCFLLLSFSTSSKKMPSNFVQIPSGFTYVDGHKIPVDEFYISSTEVSNKEYKEFLQHLKSNGDAEKLKTASVHHERWKDVLKENAAPFVEFYFEKDEYNEYPVVNISLEAAVLYCEWLTEKYRKMYNNPLITVQLPSKIQWTRAAKGETEHDVYAWGSSETHNAKNQMLGNFKTNDNTVTAPVVSYNKNQFGIYNMSGNVAEMIANQKIALGGSWHTDIKSGKLSNVFSYNVSSPMVGFRPVIVFNQ